MTIAHRFIAVALWFLFALDDFCRAVVAKVRACLRSRVFRLAWHTAALVAAVHLASDAGLIPWALIQRATGPIDPLVVQSAGLRLIYAGAAVALFFNVLLAFGNSTGRTWADWAEQIDNGNMAAAVYLVGRMASVAYLIGAVLGGA